MKDIFEDKDLLQKEVLYEKAHQKTQCKENTQKEKRDYSYPKLQGYGFSDDIQRQTGITDII